MSKNCSNFDKSNKTSVTKTEFMICGFFFGIILNVYLSGSWIIILEK